MNLRSPTKQNGSPAASFSGAYFPFAGQARQAPRGFGYELTVWKLALENVTCRRR